MKSGNKNYHLTNIYNLTKSKKIPKWYKPMLAKLTHEHFSNEKWIYERKLV